jgi:hypothetical protein
MERWRGGAGASKGLKKRREGSGGGMGVDAEGDVLREERIGQEAGEVGRGRGDKRFWKGGGRKGERRGGGRR